MNPKSTMGPVISAKALDRCLSMVNPDKHNILVGGTRMEGASQLDGFDYGKGYFYAPTVVADVQPEDELFQEEVFGPVVSVTRFEVRLSQDHAGALLLTSSNRPKRKPSSSRTTASTALGRVSGQRTYRGPTASLGKLKSACAGSTRITEMIPAPPGEST